MATDAVESLLLKYQRRGILVDTNLLLLYFIGNFDRDLIHKFKRTVQYSIDDFDLLDRLLRFFAKLVTTPNILTEISNLSNFPETTSRPFFHSLRGNIELLDERYCASLAAASDKHFHRIGLTDASILNLCENEFLVLTDDFRLAQILESRGIDVVNFNHIRVLGWK